MDYHFKIECYSYRLIPHGKGKPKYTKNEQRNKALKTLKKMRRKLQ